MSTSNREWATLTDCNWNFGYKWWQSLWISINSFNKLWMINESKLSLGVTHHFRSYNFQSVNGIGICLLALMRIGNSITFNVCYTRMHSMQQINVVTGGSIVTNIPTVSFGVLCMCLSLSTIHSTYGQILCTMQDEMIICNFEWMHYGAIDTLCASKTNDIYYCYRQAAVSIQRTIITWVICSLFLKSSFDIMHIWNIIVYLSASNFLINVRRLILPPYLKRYVFKISFSSGVLFLYCC